MPVCRRTPTQERSREKYEQILHAAKQLIGERGNDAVSMREIAKAAGVAPSSIYQYFPDKNAILAAIMQDYFDQVDTLLQALTDRVRTVDELSAALDAGVDQFYALFAREPVLATLWAGIQANTVLRELDNDDSVSKARLLTAALCRLLPQASQDEAFDAALLLIQTLGLVVRMALTMSPEQGQRLIAEFKRLSRLRLAAFGERAQG